MKIGIIGWRGMVGSVLVERMIANNDFQLGKFYFYSTSQAGKPSPKEASNEKLYDAYDLEALKKMDIIITCQGGEYTKEVYKKLRQTWKGYWIDAASTLRMEKEALIILDPVNRVEIDTAIEKGMKTFVGGNCTVSLMLMALGGLFKEDLVEWVSSMTYQAASGAGAKNMKELVNQMQSIGKIGEDPSTNNDVLTMEKEITKLMKSNQFPMKNFGHPLASSLLPWIDVEMENGQSKEEFKGMSETNKILNTTKDIPIDGTCVRIGALRCHSQAFCVKLNQDISIEKVESLISNHNEWVKVIPNKKKQTLKSLTPTAVSGTLEITVGRIRKMNLGDQFINIFSCGDQLLWGAAEPLRRMLLILSKKL